MSLESSIGALLPSVDALLKRPDLVTAGGLHGHATLLAAVRAGLSEVRQTIMAGTVPLPADRAAVARLVEERALALLARRAMPSLRRVFNLTGTVLHTNLGRSPLPREAVDAITEAAGACNVEFDLVDGGRNDRDEHVAVLLRRMTGAEDALVVNNNAAAVLLALNSLALRREVIVSRGELIEIGGEFRMPDVMARAGCKLREVGTTNRTHVSDYEGAIGPRTAALMKVHPSNFAISGFTAAVQDTELAAVASRHGLPFIVDLGSGTLTDLGSVGLPPEPTLRTTLEHGADLVTFSGDKLMGGPQAGLVVGRADLVARLKRNPLKRALRVDKIILAALAATLRLHEDPEHVVDKLPCLRLLVREESVIRALAHRLSGPVGGALGEATRVTIEPCSSQIGSGSLPVDRLPSWSLVLRTVGPRRGIGSRLDGLVRAFRALPIPVIGRLHGGALVFDLRCLEDEAAFLGQLDRLANSRQR